MGATPNTPCTGRLAPPVSGKSVARLGGALYLDPDGLAIPVGEERSA